MPEEAAMLDVYRCSAALPAPSPSPALFAVAAHGPPAGEPLLRWFWSRRWWSGAAQIREEVLQDVATTLLASASSIVASLRARNPDLRPGPTADPVVVSYVRSMVRNRVVDDRRRREGFELPTGLAYLPHLEERVDLAAALRVVDRAVHRAGAGDPAMAARLDELERLSVGATTMDEVVAAQLAPGDCPVRVRSRLHKRHQRARLRLRRIIDAMARSGEVPAGVADHARRWADVLYLRRAPDLDR